MKLSIGFFTGREEPRLDWVVEALAKGAEPGDELELIVIDALFHDRVAGKVPECVDRRVFDALGGNYGRSYVLHSRGSGSPAVVTFGMIGIDGSPIKTICEAAPKPTIWQGKHRVTSSDWWAMANARNTFLCLASHDYIVGIDDRGRPGPGWLPAIRSAEKTRDSVCAGSYDKLMGPPNGITERVISADHRRQSSPTGKINCGGGWLYGCTFCLPLEWALEVNGFEEGNDGLTGEDYLFGLMLENAGRRIDFVPALYVRQDRAEGDQHSKDRYRTLDKGVPPNDKSHAALARFGSRARTEVTPDLREIRARLARGEGFPIPDPAGDHRDWFDDQRICDM